MPSTSTSYVDGVPRWWSTARAVEALPWGSRSSTSTRSPCWASAAAMFTARRRLADATLLVGHHHHPGVVRPRHGGAGPASLTDEQLLLDGTGHRCGRVVPVSLRGQLCCRSDAPVAELPLLRQTPPDSPSRSAAVFHVKQSRPVDNPALPVDEYAHGPSLRSVDNFRRGSCPATRRSAPTVVPTLATKTMLSPLIYRFAHRDHGDGRVSHWPTHGLDDRGSTPPSRRIDRGCRVRARRRPRSPSWRARSPPGRTRGSDHPASRSMGATARDVTTSNTLLTVKLLGPSPHDVHVGQPHCGHSELQKRGATQQRLQQSHGKIRAPDRQHDSGQSGATPHVADGAVRGHQVA